MSFTLPGHGVCSCSAKVRGVCLSTLISTMGRCASKKRVSKSHMQEPLIANHSVISRESSCEHGVQASVDTLLSSPLHSLLCTIRGNHPPACEGLKVYPRCFAQSHVPTKACVDTGYDNE